MRPYGRRDGRALLSIGMTAARIVGLNSCLLGDALLAEMVSWGLLISMYMPLWGGGFDRMTVVPRENLCFQIVAQCTCCVR